MVRARDSAETGVHIRRNSHHTAHADVLRQQTVELIGQLLAVNGLRSIPVGGHHARMYARVGTARAHHLHILAQECGERALQLGLYRITVGLHLPPMIACAVVAEKNKITLHNCARKGTTFMANTPPEHGIIFFFLTTSRTTHGNKTKFSRKFQNNVVRYFRNSRH